MMKFKFNEEKTKRFLNIPVNALYLKIDQILAKDGIYPTEQGVYLASEEKGFYPFGFLRCGLPETDWFMKVIDEWYWLDDIEDIKNIERYNCLKTYERWGY